MKVFQLFDDDNSGHITFRNLKKVAQELGENLADDELMVCLIISVVSCSPFLCLICHVLGND